MIKYLFPFSVFALILMLSCVPIRTYKMCKYGNIGQIRNGKPHYFMFLKNNQTGSLHTISTAYSRDDSLLWRYKNGIIYFKFFSTRYDRGNAQNTPSFPNYGLYNHGHVLIQSDSLSLLLYNMKIADFRQWDRAVFIPYLQESGFEDKLIKKCFGDSIRIQKKLKKVIMQTEIFK